MLDVTVISDPATAAVSLDAVRSLLLAELAEPGSATSLAKKLGMLRQKVNYHLNMLERHELIELVEERRRGNCTERIFRAVAAAYVISPTVLSSVEPDPSRSPDRLSAQWLLSLATRLVRDVGELVTGAARARKRVATFALDGEVRFASAADRAAFAKELTESVTKLVNRYHVEHGEGGRFHRVVVGIHPSVPQGPHGVGDLFHVNGSEAYGIDHNGRDRNGRDLQDIDTHIEPQAQPDVKEF